MKVNSIWLPVSQAKPSYPAKGMASIDYLKILQQIEDMKQLLYVLICLLATTTLISAQSPGSGDNNITVTGNDKTKLVENVLIADWNDAKTKYKWDWLETSKEEPTAYRYFSDNKLMVVCKAPAHAWTQADLPFSPLPVSWFFEATFSNVKGKSENCETGLLLKAKSNGEEVKVFFVVNHFDQTYAFIQYNMTTRRWLHLNTLVGNSNNFSAAINKYNAQTDFASNKLRLQRDNNNFLLYVNDKLIETVTVYDPASDLNKMHGIGITGKGHQAYYVDKIKFAVNTTVAKEVVPIKNEVKTVEKKPTPIKEKVTPVSNKTVQVHVIPPSLDKALMRDIPVKIGGLDIYLVHNLDAAGIEKAKAAFKNKFREADFDEIVKRANINNYPSALNTVNKIDKLPYPGGIYDAQGYLQGSFLLPFNGGAQLVHLVWMPVAGNPTLTGEQLPPGGQDAFYFITNVSYYNVNTKSFFLPSRQLPSTSFIATMKEKHRKSYPGTIDFPNSRPDYDGFFAYEPLQKAGYSDEEIKRIFQLSTKQYKPQATRDMPYEKQIELFKRYKAYNILDFEESDGRMGLFWVPKEEAGNMPDTLQPLTEEGMFLFVRTSFEKTDYQKSSRKFVNKPKGELSGIGYTVDVKKPVTPKTETNKPTEKYSAAQVYKAEQTLISYLKQTDREFNPLAEKILKSGKDKWILYKTREKALRIVDGQIQAINSFLKDYGDYTTPSFKSDIQNRLAVAEAARYKI